MTQGRKQKPESLPAERRPRQPAKIGALLLELHEAICSAQRCRQGLARFGFPQSRWQEIINDVETDLRFMVRPKILDSIVAYLHAEGRPVARADLVQELSAQGAGYPRNIRQSITNNVRKKKLAVFPKNRIGLPEWKARRSMMND